MSTTMLSASRSVRLNRASTTNVAPCRRWAGPKTSPRKLCAIIMRSRTVTLNMGSLSAVGDSMAQCGKRPLGQPAEDVRQLVELGLAGDQRVECGVAEQVEGERQPVGEGTAGPPGRRDGSDLAATDGEA